jgi:hypothetical protein
MKAMRATNTPVAEYPEVLVNKWQELQENVGEHLEEIKDIDLDHLRAERDAFVELLQEKYGYTKQEAVRRLDEWLTAVEKKKDEWQTAVSPSFFRRHRTLIMITAVLSLFAAAIYYYFVRTDSY